MAAYLDILIHTSDTSPYSKDRDKWTEAEIAYDRASNMKQGYVQMVKPAGSPWGKMSLDPKRFLKITIPEIQWDPKWLDRVVESGEDIQDARWKFDIDKILSLSEKEALYNIPYNSDAGYTISKSIEDAASLVKLVDWEEELLREPLKLHGSAGTHNIDEDGSLGGYDNLKEAVETEAADLTAGGGQGKAIFKIQEAWTNPDTGGGNFDIDGYTVDVDNYIEIYADGVASHDGGVYRATGWRIDHATQMFDIEQDFTLVHDVQKNGDGLILLSANACDGVEIYNSVLRGAAAISIPNAAGETAYVYCNVILDDGATGNGVVGNANGTVNIWNDTISGFAKGIDANGGATGTFDIRNCPIFNNTDDIDTTDVDPTININTCATDQGAGEGTNGVNIAATWDSTCFVDAGGLGPDFGVQDAASPLDDEGNGATPKAKFTTDIAGTTMGPADADWPIGAFQLPGAPPAGIVVLRRRIEGY